MSKAFVKDDSGSELDSDAAAAFDMEDDLDDADASEDSGGSARASGKNYITKKGFDVLKSEIGELLNVERPRVVEVVAWAASNGDRSENADYTYGKKRLREIDKRIRFLQRRIDRAEIVYPEQQNGDRVLFGATVSVLDESDATRVYKIVGVDETDARTGKVSWMSPIGKALLQARVGDSVLLRTPKGEEELEIKKIEFKNID